MVEFVKKHALTNLDILLIIDKWLQSDKDRIINISKK